jgi:rhodanese-related sulfurtransferase
VTVTTAPAPGGRPAPFGVDALRALRVSGAVHALIDVREHPETDAGHIPGASTVPMRTLPLRMAELLPTTGLDIVVVDGGDEDRRAAAAVELLRSEGHARAVVLDGGLAAWAAAGHRVERGRNVPSKRFGELLLDGAEEDLLVAPETLADWMAEGRVERILDVRTAAEHERECIPGSQHAAGFDVVAAALARTDPSRPLVVHCTGRTRGIVAASTLRLLGLPNVHALENGTMGWKLAGLELEHGARRVAPADAPDEDAAATHAAVHAIARDAGVERLSPAVAAERLRTATVPTLLFDVRSPAEHSEAAPDGSIGVPSGQLVQQLDDHLVIAGAHAILIDDGGVRAPIAAFWLRRIGVAAVAVVDGGIAAWQAAGLPVGPPALRPLPGPVTRAQARVDAVDSARLEVLLSEGATVVSVASSLEHAAGHLEGSRWLFAAEALADPERVLTGVLGDAPDAARREVTVTCEDGTLSAVVAARLDAVMPPGGHVRRLEGGVRAWRASGRPLSTDATDIPRPAPDVIEHPIHVGAAAMRAYLDWELELEHDADRDG